MKPSDLPNPRDFRCHLPIQVRFADLDRLGHVNNATYQQYYDLGRLAYFDMLPASRPDWNGRVPVIAHLELDFLAPVTMRNQVAVCTRVVHVGERCVRVEQLLYRPGAEPGSTPGACRSWWASTPSRPPLPHCPMAGRRPSWPSNDSPEIRNFTRLLINQRIWLPTM